MTSLLSREQSLKGCSPGGHTLNWPTNSSSLDNLLGIGSSIGRTISPMVLPAKRGKARSILPGCLKGVSSRTCGSFDRVRKAALAGSLTNGAQPFASMIPAEMPGESPGTGRSTMWYGPYRATGWKRDLGRGAQPQRAASPLDVFTDHEPLISLEQLRFRGWRTDLAHARG